MQANEVMPAAQPGREAPGAAASALLAWSDDFVLGVSEMDATHREFVEHLNVLARAEDAALLEGLDAFIEHTVAHFGQEREWMVNSSFPKQHCHAAEHDGVLGIMREVRGMVAEGQFELGRVLVRELAPWFTNHAVTMDAVLAMHLQGGPIEPCAGSECENYHLHGAAD